MWEIRLTFSFAGHQVRQICIVDYVWTATTEDTLHTVAVVPISWIRWLFHVLIEFSLLNLLHTFLTCFFPFSLQHSVQLYSFFPFLLSSFSHHWCKFWHVGVSACFFKHLVTFQDGFRSHASHKFWTFVWLPTVSRWRTLFLHATLPTIRAFFAFANSLQLLC